jgi:hypothetical protein
MKLILYVNFGFIYLNYELLNLHKKIKIKKITVMILSVFTPS